MSKVNFNKLLSLIIVLLLVLPGIVLAATGTSIPIKSVYFQDESGNMVYVDYEEAIKKSLTDDYILYNGIKYHVGKVELKGRPLFLETNTGKILDYGKAMKDNSFRLEDIIDNEKYAVSGSIAYTHELRVVNGVAVIVKIPVVVPVDLVSIKSVNNITVDNGTTLENAINSLESTTTILDNKGTTHIVNLDWTIDNYDGNEAGEYNATGTFSLPVGINNPLNLALEVDATVTVQEEVVQRDIESIAPVKSITVDNGTTLLEAINSLDSTTTILDSKGATHTVNLNWSINGYDGNVAGTYNATGTFDLPAGVNNSVGLLLQVTANVTVTPPVVKEWPEQVEDVFVGQSAITGNTYANINIKTEYVSVVLAVYVDDVLAEKLDNQPSQWRIIVADDTTVESLIGRVTVMPEIVEIKDFDVKLDKDQYTINEEIRLTGVVSKEGIELENIDITLKVELENDLIVVGQLTTDGDGKLSYTFMMPEDALEGEYIITIKGNDPLNETIYLNFTLTK